MTRLAAHDVTLANDHRVGSGPPRDVVTAELVADVFGLPCRVIEDRETGGPLMVPRARVRRAATGVADALDAQGPAIATRP